MAKSSKGPIVKTPKGSLSYPYFISPDVGGQYSDNKYKTKIVIPLSEAADVKEAIDNFANKSNPKYLKAEKVPYKLDDEGNIIITAKSSYRPKVVDCAGNVMMDSDGVYVQTRINGGTTARLMMRLNDYEKGINAYIMGVRVLELATPEGAEWDDEDEGYVAPSVSTESIVQETINDSTEGVIEEDDDDDDF